MIQNLLNQMVYFAFFHSILLVFIYVFSAKNRRRINPFLAIFLGVLTLGLTGRVIYLSGWFVVDERWIVFSELATLFFGATTYLFTQSSLHQHRFERAQLKHYIFPLLYNVAVVITFIVLAHQPKPFWISMTFIGTGLAFNIMYFVASIRVFMDFRKKLKNELSHVVQTRFFTSFLSCIGGCLLCWSIMFVMGLFDSYWITRTSWQLVWFSLAIVILFITYHGIQDPELYRIQIPVEAPIKYAKSKYSQSDLDELKQRLDQLMNSKKPYLNRKLLKSELAELLGVSKPELARLLNERIGMSFFEYVNYFRIKELIALAETEKAKELTLFGLAQEAGFNSKTTFNKSFKAIMGTTPSVYFDAQ